jgi:uncharacterized protein (TIGR02246 family)
MSTAQLPALPLLRELIVIKTEGVIAMNYADLVDGMIILLKRYGLPFALVLLLLLSVGGTPLKKDRELSAQDKAKIEALSESYRAAWIANDREAILNTLAENAVLLPHHGHPPVVGTSAIVKFWWPADAPPTTVTGFTMTTDEIRGNGDIGYVWGKFSLAFNYEEKGQKKSLSNAGTYLMIVRRQASGSWLITHRIWDDPVAQATSNDGSG